MPARSRQHPLYQEDLAHILATAGIERLRGTHILLTGATGLIGTQLVDALMRYNAQGAAIRITAAGRSRQRAAERAARLATADSVSTAGLPRVDDPDRPLTRRETREKERAEADGDLPGLYDALVHHPLVHP